MKTVSEILKSQTDANLIQMAKELKGKFMPMDAQVRKVCAEIFNCEAEHTNTMQFAVLAMSLAIELGDRLDLLINKKKGLSEEIYNEALRLKKLKALSIEERLIKFSLSKVNKMSNGDYSNTNTNQVLKCINKSYKESVRLLAKNDKLYLNQDSFSEFVKNGFMEHGIKINL